MQKKNLIEGLRQLSAADRREILAEFPEVQARREAPRVFLSYSRSDIFFVRDLMAGLERGGVRVWFDVRELMIGEDYLAATEQGLRESDYCLVVVSRYSMTSVEVLRELTIAQTIGTTILPVILQDAEIAAPARNLQWIDFRFHFEAPLAGLVTQLHGRTNDELVAQRFHSATKPLNPSRAILQRLQKGAPTIVKVFFFLHYVCGMFLFFTAMPFFQSGTWAGGGFIVFFALLLIVTTYQIADRQQTLPSVRAGIWSLLVALPIFTALFCVLLPAKLVRFVAWSELPPLLTLVAALLILELSPTVRRWLPARPAKREFLPEWLRAKKGAASPAAPS